MPGYSVLHYTLLEKPLHQLFKRWFGLSSAPANKQGAPDQNAAVMASSRLLTALMIIPSIACLG